MSCSQSYTGCMEALGIAGAFVPARDVSVRRRISVIFLLSAYAAAVSVSDQRNASPVSHIWCMMTASLRATATFALFMQLRLATRSPQDLSADHDLVLDSNELAASYR